MQYSYEAETESASEKFLVWLVAIAAFLSPFSTLRLFGLYFTVADSFLILAGIVALTLQSTWAKEHPGTKRAGSTLRTRWIVGGVCILVGFLLSEIAAPSGPTSIVSTSLQYAFVFIYLPLLFSQLDVDGHLKAIKAFVVGLLVIIVAGAVLSAYFPSIYQKFDDAGLVVGVLRVGSFMGVNDLAKSIAICIPLVLLLYTEKRLKRVPLLLAFSILALGLVLSASWAGIISSGIAVLLLCILWWFRKPFKTSIAVLALALVLAATFVAVTAVGPDKWMKAFDKRIVQVVQGGDINKAGSFVIKRDLMKEALTVIEQRPLVGTGAGRYEGLSQYGVKVHNSYLLLWAEGGVLALIGLLLILISSFSLSCRYAFRSETYRFGIPVLVLVSVFALNAFTSTALYSRFDIIPLLLSVDLLAKRNISKGFEWTYRPGNLPS